MWFSACPRRQRSWYSDRPLPWPRLVTMKRVSVPSPPASTRATIRRTRLQLPAASWNSLKRRGFQPIVVFDQDGRFVTAVLRPAKRPKGDSGALTGLARSAPEGWSRLPVEIRAFLRRLVGAIRTSWPQVEILLRADSHYACPEVLDWCEANGLDYILGLAPTSTLKRHVGGLDASTSARFKADSTAGKVRRFKEFHDARVEAGGDGTDTRFIVTNLGH